MAINQKLTNIIEGRVVKNCREGSGEVQIRFQDGSKIMVKVMESNSPPLREGSQVRCVHENGKSAIYRCSTHFGGHLPNVAP